MSGGDELFMGQSFRAGLRFTWALLVLGAVLATLVLSFLSYGEARRQTEELRLLRHMKIEQGAPHDWSDR